MNNVFLTGFMATGKTAVGRALAERLRRRFVDVDAEIERGTGLSVSEIFRRFGEPDFRARERETLAKVSGDDDVVIATGGGSVIDPRNRAVMRRSGTIVCLSADPRAILERLGEGGDRPLLAGAKDRAARIADLLAERAAAYADADVTFDTSGKNAAEVARRIADWLASRTPGRKAVSRG
jgi:shikimate kinase